MFKKISKYFVFCSIAVIVGVATVSAGSLTPPGSVLNTMYTLTDLYNLASGTVVAIGSGAIPSTPGSVSETFHSLTDVYTVISTEINKLSADKIATGTTAFGLTGTLQSGLLRTNVQRCQGSSGDEFGYYWGDIPCTGTKQDVDPDYRKGISRSYTDNGDGTVTESYTGLMWQKCSAGQNATNCSGSASLIKFDNAAGVQPAVNYCEGLSLATKTDWRLPNRFELESILDLSRGEPAIDPIFSNTVSDLSIGYWSSTPDLSSLGGRAWLVTFYSGEALSTLMDSTNHVRCVRDL